MEKRVLSFIDDDRSSLRDIKIDSEVRLWVKNQKNEYYILPFRVTRDAYLGTSWRWIYGAVIVPDDRYGAVNVPDDRYYQVEIRLNLKNPAEDTIEVFLKAPPATYNKLR